MEINSSLIMSDADIFDNKLRKEYDDLCDSKEWNSLLQRIKNNSSMKLSGIECSVARSIENRSKNIYRKVVPYDFNRVILSKVAEEGSDYINASHICLHRRRYITTQYPDDKTVDIFWSMVWQSKTPGIIMLGKFSGEHGESYFPKLDETLTVTNGNDSGENVYDIYTESELTYDGFVQRKLRIHNVKTNEKMELWHFEFWSWPDHGVPRCMQSFLTLLGVSRQYNIVDSIVGPAIIHCSAGAGRSGTFCLVDIAIMMAEEDENLNNINIPVLVEELRGQRMGMIRSFAQLKFCYEAVMEAFTKYRSFSKPKLGGSYLLSTDNPHSCPNDDIVAPSSSFSDDAASDTVLYSQMTDESDDSSSDQKLSKCEDIGDDDESTADFVCHKLLRDGVLCRRILKNQERIKTLRRHLRRNSLRRYRLVSASLALMKELNTDYYKSVTIVASAVLFLCWLNWSPSKYR